MSNAIETPEVFTVKIETLKLASKIFHTASDVLNERSIALMSLSYLACQHVRLHQFSSAQVLGWAVIEQLLRYMWEEYQSEQQVENNGHTVLSVQRKRKLNGSDYSASTISEILSLAKKIDDELLQRLDAARKIRNKFAHEALLVSSDEAMTTIALSSELLSKVVGLNIPYNFGISASQI